MDIFKRKKAKEDFEVIADVDAVVASPIGFRLHGKDHKIDPITTEQFLNWSNSLAHLYSLKDKKEVSPEEMIEAYFQIIGSLCKTITKEDIRKCEQAQLAALYGLIFDHCTGRAHVESYQKKKNTMMRETQEKKSLN